MYLGDATVFGVKDTPVSDGLTELFLELRNKGFLSIQKEIDTSGWEFHTELEEPFELLVGSHGSLSYK